MNDNSNPMETTMEVMPPSAIHALERAAIDTQVATAHQYPRKMDLFKSRSMMMATLDEDTADSCIYCRPVGKEKDPKTGQWKEKFAEGPSIRLAEIVACSYGNIRVSARIVEQTDRFVRCEGVAHDLETNYAGKSEIIESTVTKEGHPYSERQRALTAKVALSKAYRDAIFKVVPRALCKPVYEAAKKVAAGQDKPLEERRKKAQAWVSSLRIDEARVFSKLSVNGWSDITAEHLLILTGLKTGMQDGELTIDEVFPPVVTKAEPPAGSKTTTSKTPQDASKTTVSHSETKPAQNAATAPMREAGEALKSTTTPPAEAATTGKPAEEPGTDEKTEAEMGLAPETKSESATQTTTEGTTTESMQADPAFTDRDSDSDALKSIKLLGRQSGITAVQLRSWARANQLAKESQNISDLAESKLMKIVKNWATILPEIKKLARE